jgi:hypothetical protein
MNNYSCSRDMAVDNSQYIIINITYICTSYVSLLKEVNNEIIVPTTKISKDWTNYYCVGSGKFKFSKIDFVTSILEEYLSVFLVPCIFLRQSSDCFFLCWLIALEILMWMSNEQSITSLIQHLVNAFNLCNYNCRWK